jgi:hypothetical protein
MTFKIISGGQTGADYGALVGAKLSGVETGGTAPKWYRTENGPNLVLRDVFGLVEHESTEYPPRTECNAKEADLTVWLGNLPTPGYTCTVKFVRRYKKAFQVVDKDWQERHVSFLAGVISSHNFKVINFAGNRESKNPGLQERTCDFVKALIEELRKREYIQ